MSDGAGNAASEATVSDPGLITMRIAAIEWRGDRENR